MRTGARGPRGRPGIPGMGGGGSAAGPVTTQIVANQTTSATLPDTYLYKYVIYQANTSGLTLTLPSAAAAADGTWILLKNGGLNSFNITGQAALAATNSATYVVVSNAWVRL